MTSKYQYEASFKTVPYVAHGTIEAENMTQAEITLRLMSGKWKTARGKIFEAGRPDDFLIVEDK